MTSAPDTRIHPIAAWHAIRALLRDREDTRQVFLLMDALRGKTSLGQLARFRRTQTGWAVLAERRQLIDWLQDRASLAALPSGTLGRAFVRADRAQRLRDDCDCRLATDFPCIAGPTGPPRGF